MADIPMFHFDVRPVPQPYQSPYTQSMAQLIGAGDRYQADAIQQSAAARARGVEAIGHDVGGTLLDYAKFQLAQQTPTAQLQRLKVKKELDDMADEELIQKTVAANGGDVEKALAQMRSGGNVPISALGKLQAQVDTSRNAALKTSADTLEYKSKVLKQTSQMLPESPVKPDDPNQVSAFTTNYANVYPALVKTVGPQFATNLPDPTDPDLVTKVDTLRKWGLSASEAIRLQTAGLEKIREARLTKEDDRKANDADMKGISLRLSTAQNQGDWDGILTESKAQGVNPAVLARFPAEFSPKAVNVARVLASGKPDEPAKPGTLDDYMTKWATEHGTTQDKITGPQLLKLRHDYAESGHIASVAGGDLSDAQVNDYVQVIKENPGAYRGLTETMKSRLMVPLAKAGFKGFDAPTQAMVVSANNTRTRELNKIDRDVTQGLITEAEAAGPRQRVETTYRTNLQLPVPFDPNNQTRVFPGAPAAPPPTPPVALNPNLPTPAPVPGARPGSGLPVPPAAATAGPPGLLVPGNIDLTNRPQVKNQDGSISTVRSMSTNIDGKEVLIPTVVGNKVVSNAEAIAEYKRTGKHLGIFDTADNATQFAQALHASEEAKLQKPQPGGQAAISPPMGPQDLLKGMKPGKYKLSDGTKWQVNRDGSVVKAP